MSCCSSTPCTCDNCDTCTSQSAFTSPILEVNKGTTLLVEDRNGNPKKLKKKEFSLAASVAGGSTELRDGSLKDPINLKFLQALLNGNAVLVRNGQGNLGVATPVEDDTFLAYVGGVLQFVKSIPRTTLFSNDDLSAQSGRLAVVGCSSGGFSEIGYFTGTGDYLSASEGQLIANNFCDASTTEELDYLIGCSGGVLSKIAPQEGFILAEEGGKWVSKETTVDEVSVAGADIWSKSYSSVNDITFADTTVAFGSGVPSTAKWVQIRVTTYCSSWSTYGVYTVFINGMPVIKSKVVNSFGKWDGSVCLYVPYGSGSLTVRGQLVVSTAGNTTGDGQLAIGVISYR